MNLPIKGTPDEGREIPDPHLNPMPLVIPPRTPAGSLWVDGGDVATLDGFSVRLLTDPDLLACSQNGVMGKLVFAKEGIEVRQTREKGLKKRECSTCLKPNREAAPQK